MTTAKTQHTPEPWEISDCDNDGYQIVNPQIPGKHIATVHVDDMDPAECESNANLIKAAPDLYAALKAVESWGVSAIGHLPKRLDNQLAKLSHQIAAAIDKADGTSTDDPALTSD